MQTKMNKIVELQLRKVTEKHVNLRKNYLNDPTQKINSKTLENPRAKTV